jgi:Tat protein secretion system quality control protein TatD with DNase activity
LDQLVLPPKVKLPVIIHCRQAHDDLMAILKDFKKEYKHLLPADKEWA